MQLVSFTGSMKKSFHFQDQRGKAVELFARELEELMSQLSGPRPRSWGRSAREEGLTLQRGGGGENLDLQRGGGGEKAQDPLSRPPGLLSRHQAQD